MISQSSGHRRNRFGVVLATAAVLAGGVGLVAPVTASAATVTKTFVVDAKTAGANGVFVNSDVVVAAGAPVTVTATGAAHYDPTLPLVGPDGYFNNSGSFTVTITYTPACTGIFCFGS